MTEQELKNKIVELIGTSGKKLLPLAQTEILAMIMEYTEEIKNSV